ncbi:MAG: hypothetical protein J7K83_01215, partial [Candidatus Aenigmarchaeota archaeon]|nr:hypothetical protein [Candidatus Aenigmarchaeota archaeon]
PFDEYTARIHIYNQNVSIDAGFKLIGVVPDVKLVVKDAYTANECSDTIIPVKIINAGDEPEKVTLYVDSPINYTMDETTFTINKKSTLAVPITFHIPCNSTKSEYIVKFMIGKNSYYTTINTKSKNVNGVETLIWFILVALIAIAVIAVVKRIEIRQMRCWRKNKDELVI